MGAHLELAASTVTPDRGTAAPERVVAAVTGAPGSEVVISRAARLARRQKAELLGVHVRTPGEPDGGPADLLDAHRRLLVSLGGSYHEVVGSDAAPALLQLARAEGATQLVLGATRRSRWPSSLARHPGPVDVCVVTSRSELDQARAPVARRRGALLPPRRRSAAWLMAAFGVPLLTAVLLPIRGSESLPGVLLVFLLLVVAVAVVGGAWPAAAVAVAGVLAVNWFLTPPFHTLIVATVENLLALFTFLAVGAVVSFLVGQVARRSAEASRARTEAEALARAAGGLVGADDPLPALTQRVRTTFELDAVAVLVRRDGAWQVDAHAGHPVPLTPAEAVTTIPVGEDGVLALVGPELAADDRRVLNAFAAQLATALERRRLRAEAGAAAVLAEADELRTALLRAVSHDLRTPLASIKASVTSLRQGDIDWSEEAVEEFLGTIEDETDRLNGLVGNLLDIGRLQAGAVRVSLRAVGLEEIVPAALASLSADTSRVDLVLDELSPPVDADPALLERAVANVISNALAWTPPGGRIRVAVDQADGRVELRVVDQGPGVPPEDRARLFEPFQRLGDRSNDTGAGLGLAVARGFVEAMGARLWMEDGPSGGLAVVFGFGEAS